MTGGISYRIGINLGDILIEGDDIVGDGLNAQRGLKSRRTRRHLHLFFSL